VIGGLIGIVAILGIVCLVHYLTDPFEMAYSLKEVKRMCVKNGSTIAELKEVLEKMETCPEIGNYVEPILVESITYKLEAFIVGDKYGKPRFFAYEKREGDKDVYKKMAKSKFKKYGLLHSISKEELKVILDEASKIRYKKDLEEKQCDKIRKHFR
jgi:hypothetical protein